MQMLQEFVRRRQNMYDVTVYNISHLMTKTKCTDRKLTNKSCKLYDEEKVKLFPNDMANIQWTQTLSSISAHVHFQNRPKVLSKFVCPFDYTAVVGSGKQEDNKQSQLFKLTIISRSATLCNRIFVTSYRYLDTIGANVCLQKLFDMKFY